RITALALVSAEGHQTIELLNRDLQAKVEKIAEQQRRILALQSQLRRQGSGPRVAAAWARGQGPVPAREDGQAESSPLMPIRGNSLEVRRLLGMIRKVAETDTVVLIRGESGTGKGLLAQAVHDASPRAGKAFVKVHCAALAPNLLESELFGHIKG